jgi:hypothetical protein
MSDTDTKLPKNPASRLEASELFNKAKAVAVFYGTDPNDLKTNSDLLSIFSTLREKPSGLRRGSNDYLKREPTPEGFSEFDLYRAVLRQEVIVNSVVTADNDFVFYGEFHGYGDSGDYEIETGNKYVDEFLIEMLDQYVEFDWYNNDGGGGDITWHVLEDRIVINGFYNETVQQSAMTEEEF